MNKDEIVNWFVNIFNDCYPVKHKDFNECTFYYYDENYIRLKKLSKLSGKIITPKKVSGKCIFYIDSYSEYLKEQIFVCDYGKIWGVICDNLDNISDKKERYNTTHLLIKEILESGRLNSSLSLVGYSPRYISKIFINGTEDKENLYILK